MLNKLNSVQRLFWGSTTLAILPLLVACASEPKVNELSSTSNPQVEIDRVGREIDQAEVAQVDILSPTNFTLAKKSWRSAIEGRAENRDQKFVLHNVAVAQAYLDQAAGVAGVANQLLKGPIEARRDALTAKAHVYFAKEISAADQDFLKLTRQVENNDTSGAEKRRGKIEVAYRDLEIRAILEGNLGSARKAITEAKKEGAKKLTPDTLAWAEKQYALDEAAIIADRHNPAVVGAANTDATAAGMRLMRLVRNAKGASAQNPEQIAIQGEEKDLAVARSKSDLVVAAGNLASTKSQLATQTSENTTLHGQVSFEMKYDNARAQFSAEEAEVQKLGDKVLLRLKGLSFRNNQATIPTTQFALLSKVQKVIADISPSHVLIEGHTDSIGGSKQNAELSRKRAEAVLSYLVANEDIDAKAINAEGLADTKPIATNKTPAGRAQNRRIDILISQ